MMADGVLGELRPAAESGARHQYCLTEKGLGLRVILAALRQWGEDNRSEDGEPMTTMVDNANDEPIGRLHLAARDGREISPLAVGIKTGRPMGTEPTQRGRRVSSSAGRVTANRREWPDFARPQRSNLIC
jgi:HxlR-like helix-turn-helix